MKKGGVLILFCLFAFLLVAQNDNVQKLEEIQSALDELQYSIGEGETVEHRKINERIKSFEKLQSENDSLSLQLAIANTELMLLKSKLELCSNSSSDKTESKRKPANEFDMRNASSFMDVSSNSGEKIYLEKGYYVVLSSSRQYEKCKDYLIALKAEKPILDLMIAQNTRKSWYHICIKSAYNNNTVGKEVSKYRDMGFSDAWFIYFD